jgi:Uncharacterized conserved protein (DUF2075)
LLEWFSAVRKKFKHWQVYTSNEISDTEYTRGIDFKELFSGMQHEYISDLHLKTSIRSFRSEKVAGFVKALLDYDKDTARKLLADIPDEYPIVITRNINKAKEWLKQRARGSERFGLVASSSRVDDRTRLQALALANDCYKYKLDLVTNGVVITDAIKFVQQKKEELNELNSDKVNGDEDASYVSISCTISVPLM